MAFFLYRKAGAQAISAPEVTSATEARETARLKPEIEVEIPWSPGPARAPTRPMSGSLIQDLEPRAVSI